MKKESWFDAFERDDLARAAASQQLAIPNTAKPTSNQPRWHPLLQVLAVTVLMAGSTAPLLAPHTDRMANALRSLCGQDYAAPPFFSLGNFNTVKRGMTEGEVRARLGFPLIRSNLALGRVLWTYTAPVSRDAGSYLSCQVVFEGDPKCVRRIIQDTCRNRTTWVCNLKKPLMQEVGEIDVSTAEGDVLTLSPGDTRCHVLVTASDEYDELKGLASDHVEVLLLARSFTGWLNSGEGAQISTMGVYQSGTLYRTSPRVPGSHINADLDDRKWLVRHLLTRSVE